MTGHLGGGTGTLGPRMPESSEPPSVSGYHEETPGSVVVWEAWVPAKHRHKMYGGPKGVVERKAKPRLGQTGTGPGRRRGGGTGGGGGGGGDGGRRGGGLRGSGLPHRAVCRVAPGSLPRWGRRKMAVRPPPRSRSPPPRPGRSRQTAPASTPPAQRPRSEAAQAAREGLCLLQRGAGGGGGRLP